MERENKTWNSIHTGCQDTAMLRLNPVQWGKEAQLSPTGDWIAGWLMRYHKFNLIKRQEEEEGSLYLQVQVCVTVLFLLLPSSFNSPDCFPDFS